MCNNFSGVHDWKIESLFKGFGDKRGTSTEALKGKIFPRKSIEINHLLPGCSVLKSIENFQCIIIVGPLCRKMARDYKSLQAFLEGVAKARCIRAIFVLIQTFYKVYMHMSGVNDLPSEIDD